MNLLRSSLLLLMIFLIACSSEPYRSTGPVWVRSSWMYYGQYHIVIESDNGELRTLCFQKQPPIWAGAKFEIEYDNDAAVTCGYFSKIRRVQ